MQGRTGGSLPSWLLPTPTPEAAEKKSGPQISPLNLRTKYTGARCSPLSPEGFP